MPFPGMPFGPFNTHLRTPRKLASQRPLQDQGVFLVNFSGDSGHETMHENSSKNRGKFGGNSGQSGRKFQTFGELWFCNCSDLGNLPTPSQMKGANEGQNEPRLACIEPILLKPPDLARKMPQIVGLEIGKGRLHGGTCERRPKFLEDRNLLKLRSLDSSCPFFLSDTRNRGQ